MNKTKINIKEELAKLYSQGFSFEQSREIIWGMRSKVDTEVYAKTCFDWRQMREIRWGLEDDLNTLVYEGSNICHEQMAVIRTNLKIKQEKLTKLTKDKGK